MRDNMGLYRAKAVDNGEWVYGYYVHQYGADMIYLPDGTDREYGFDYYHIDPKTVGQYTGLTDKNSKRIIEGDILKVVDDLGYSFIGEVVFKSGSYQVKYKQSYSDSYSYHRIGHIGYFQDMGASCSVFYKYYKISNIHDNPELLKGGEE